MPLSSIALGPFLATGIRLDEDLDSTHPEPTPSLSLGRGRSESPAFRIYEEPLEVQLGKEASTPSPIEYLDDDQENSSRYVEHGDEEGLPIYRSVVTHAATNYVTPSIFDEGSDRFFYTGFQSPNQPEPLSDGQDSVIGSLSPQPGFSRNSVSSRHGSAGVVRQRTLQKTPPGGFVLYR
jgi:hypothetical protein